MAEKMRLPLIIKSVDGVGCEGVNFPQMPPYSNSYTGRRRVVNINPAQAMRGGPSQEVLPPEVSLLANPDKPELKIEDLWSASGGLNRRNSLNIQFAICSLQF